MAVAENNGAEIGSLSKNLDDTVVSSDSNVRKDLENSKPKNDSGVKTKESNFQIPSNDYQNMNSMFKSEGKRTTVITSNGKMQNGYDKNLGKSGGRFMNGSDNQRESGESLKDCEMRDLVEMLSKLNPMAAEFVPPSMANGQNFINHGFLGGNGFGYTNYFVVHTNSANTNGRTTGRKRNGYNQGKRRMHSRTSNAQQDEVIRRTVYVSGIDQQVTEEQLAGLFLTCGQVVDCRICGDPNSLLRFAFIEFTDEESARVALSLAGTILGIFPLRVLPSKTAIAPINPTFLPRSEDEREMCSRTIYCTNIDKKITQADLKLFFESVCGEVQRLRLLGDYQHSTRIAFVEFTMAESAIAALSCSGAILGMLPIRISPSKTPVRPRVPRLPLH